MSDRKKADYTEGALSTLSQVSSFLAGIFFTCLLILVQQRGQFEYSFAFFGFELRAIDLISIPLIISSLAFLFAAVTFADACATLKRKAETGAVCFFAIGLFSMIASLFFILFQISIGIAVFGVVLSIVFLAIWIKFS